MRRSLLLVVGAIGLFGAGSASALSMKVLFSEVYVDTFARAETKIQDRPLKSGRNLELDTAVAVFVIEGGSANATSNALSERLPFLTRPQRLESRTELEVHAKTKSAVEAESASAGGGLLRIQMEGSTATDPAAALSFNIMLGSADAGGAVWSFSYLVFNETRGTTLFSTEASNAGGSVPSSFWAPVEFGDILRIEWMSDIMVEASGGAESRGSLTFAGSFETIPRPVVPEPGTLALLSGGLLVLDGARRRWTY